MPKRHRSIDVGPRRRPPQTHQRQMGFTAFQRKKAGSQSCQKRKLVFRGCNVCEQMGRMAG
jgi:hypothetical protein